VDHFAAGGGVHRGHLGHVCREQVHVFHREDRVLAAHHAAHLSRPEPACVHHVLGAHLALVGDHAPCAVGALDEFFHLGEALDLRAELACGLRVGVRGTGGVEVAVDDGFQRAHETRRIQQRHQFVRALGRDHVSLDTEVAPLRRERLQPLEARLGGGKHHAAREVQTCRLAGDLLDLLIEIDGVLLELGDVRVSVHRVHAARGVPGRA
jgi:hypothetical protein